ncbi:MAG: ATP-binding cassette domain-containing protein [Verrucomicrobiota bacterium]|nr:ATP-binding cassette domain-containing protein [Verrucomicrobiota bacterium]
MMLVNHANPLLATLAGFAGGLAAGTVTGVLQTRFKINPLLAGILVMTGLYSVNLQIMGKSNVPLLSTDSLTTWVERMGQRWFGGPEVNVLGWLVSARDRVRELRMGLEDRLDTAIGSLSGGQRQALTLLMATWLKPALLLLDEHTAALDPKSADLVIRATTEIVGRHRLTTLMVTHSMQQAVNLGDRIVMMHRGAVACRFEGADKQRLNAQDLLARFEDLRRREMLDESVAALLDKTYV